MADTRNCAVPAVFLCNDKDGVLFVGRGEIRGKRSLFGHTFVGEAPQKLLLRTVISYAFSPSAVPVYSSKNHSAVLLMLTLTLSPSKVNLAAMLPK